MRFLYQQLPDHPAFDGFIIEVIGTDIIRNLSLARDIAKQSRFRKIAISIDDLGAEWSSVVGLQDFPFVELKVDREFVSGCADDRLKKTMCRQIWELAENYGARTVAEGVDTRADFLAVRELDDRFHETHPIGCHHSPLVNLACRSYILVIRSWSAYD